MPRIKNINGNPSIPCKCETWLKHWEKYTGKTAYYCSEEKCIEEDIVGAFVQKVNSSDTNRYIIPLCKFHYMSKAELDVVDTLVSANQKETCEKIDLMIRTRLYISRIFPKKLISSKL